jgi:predicted amino acid racemase
VTTPRVELRLDAIEGNTRTLVDRLAPRGIRVVAVTKAICGSPQVARALLRGGAAGIADSRVENLARLRDAEIGAPLTLLRSALGRAQQVVECADVSLNSEAVILSALSDAARAAGRTHAVVLMVELGDLREGVPVDQVIELARVADRLPGLHLIGLGTNLACQCGVVPDQRKMDQLSALADAVEAETGTTLSVVSGGNSANLEWALSTSDVGRVDELRLGEALLLGTEPMYRHPIEGLRTDACTLVAEVIEVQDKPAQPWGSVAQAAHGSAAPRPGHGTVHQALVALGRQDTDPEGLTPPAGLRILGASSDHLVLDAGDHSLSVGDEVTFGMGYGALVRATTSPYVEQVLIADLDP